MAEKEQERERGEDSVVFVPLRAVAGFVGLNKIEKRTFILKNMKQKYRYFFPAMEPIITNLPLDVLRIIFDALPFSDAARSRCVILND